jgi:hypothetical protein
MYETLTTPIESVNYQLPTIDEAVERIHVMERKKERIREGQLRKAQIEKEKKRRREEEEEAEAKREEGAKRAKTEGGDDVQGGEDATMETEVIVEKDGAGETTTAPVTTGEKGGDDRIAREEVEERGEDEGVEGPKETATEANPKASGPRTSFCKSCTCPLGERGRRLYLILT